MLQFILFFNFIQDATAVVYGELPQRYEGTVCLNCNQASELNYQRLSSNQIGLLLNKIIPGELWVQQRPTSKKQF